MKTKDNAPRVAEPNEINELFKVLFGGPDAAERLPRNIVKDALGYLDANTPEGVDHLIEVAMERGHVEGLLPDQTTVYVFRAFADAFEWALRKAGAWDESLTPDKAPATHSADESIDARGNQVLDIS